jgi:choline dehydrogenase-like flavoprotein
MLALDPETGYPPGTRGAWHQMGTTRMSAEPRNGVVDTNCRLHDVENLYVAGSAVFPTSGYTNPTLTIVAMAARLADHLRNPA